jgi:rhamnulokinase
MSRCYVACDLGAERGRVILGEFQRDRLTVSEVHRFKNQPVEEKDSLYWDIALLYQETLAGLRGVGSYLEPVESISCHSWAGDYLLFDGDGAIITPAYHHRDPRGQAGRKHVLAKVPGEAIYGETGTQQTASDTLSQLGAESSKRLHRAHHLLPVADAFNFLLAGVPRMEVSLASTTQLYNPATQNWSERVLSALRLPSKLLPPLVPAGTELGPLRPEIVKETGLEDTRVVTTCSHELAATLAGLPVSEGESWAFFRPGRTTLMGTQLPEPLINEATGGLNFVNEPVYGGEICLYKRTAGLSILEACQRQWEKVDHSLDYGMLTHLAGSAPPFESLINPTDPRFAEPDDMPQKIAAFCKETKQVVPRKPGPIFRCILESLALLYRRILQEIEFLTGSAFTRVYLIGDANNSLLNNFTANALQIPVVVAPTEAAAIGNILVQALALGHIKSVQEAREIVSNSFKMETILPHADVWNAAYERMMSLLPEE